MNFGDDMKRLIFILQKRHNLHFQVAADFAAAAFLADGETEPLIIYLETGEPLPQVLRETLIKVLKDGSRKEMRTAIQLKPIRRDGGKGAPKNRLSKAIRDGMVGVGTKDLIEEFGPGGYDAAIAQAATITGLTKSTIRDAYSRVKTRNSK